MEQVPEEREATRCKRCGAGGAVQAAAHAAAHLFHHGAEAARSGVGSPSALWRDAEHVSRDNGGSDREGREVARQGGVARGGAGWRGAACVSTHLRNGAEGGLREVEPDAIGLEERAVPGGRTQQHR